METRSKPRPEVAFMRSTEAGGGDCVGVVM
jgi:hypothetical protein